MAAGEALLGLQGVDGGIIPAGEVDLAGGMDLGDLHAEDDGIIGTGHHRVAEEIAQRVGNQRVGDGVIVHLLDQMGMGAEDDVHAALLQLLADLLLGGADLLVVLAAPVDHGDGDIRLLLGHIAQHPGDAVGVHLLVVGGVILVQKVHAVLAAGRQAQIVHALGEGHDGDADAVDVDDLIAAGLAEGGAVGEGTQGLQAHPVHDLQGGDQTGDTLADGGGIGGLDRVHADGLQGLGQLQGSRAGLRAIAAAAEIALEIQQGQIRAAENGGHIQEGLGKIIAVFMGSVVQHVIRHIQVTGRRQPDHRGAALGLGSLRLAGGGIPRRGGQCRLGGLHRFSGFRRGRGFDGGGGLGGRGGFHRNGGFGGSRGLHGFGIAACEDQHRHQQHHRRRSGKEHHFPPPALLHGLFRKPCLPPPTGFMFIIRHRFPPGDLQKVSTETS